MSLTWRALVLSFSWIQCSHLAHPAWENERESGEVLPSALSVTFFYRAGLSEHPSGGGRPHASWYSSAGHPVSPSSVPQPPSAFCSSPAPYWGDVEGQLGSTPEVLSPPR